MRTPAKHARPNTRDGNWVSLPYPLQPLQFVFGDRLDFMAPRERGQTW